VKAIGIKPDSDLPDKDKDIDVVTDPVMNPLVKKALQRNNATMCNCTLALPTSGLLGIVIKSKSKKFPNGEAWKISKMLQERFNPRDLTSKIELRVTLNKVRMTKSQDIYRAGNTIFNKSWTSPNPSPCRKITLEKVPLIYLKSIE
jgi:hypothetical protein